MIFLPGTIRASDRFARASFYINIIPKTADMFQAVASVFGVIRGVSVPLGITTPGSLTLRRPTGAQSPTIRTRFTTMIPLRAPPRFGCRWRSWI